MSEHQSLVPWKECLTATHLEGTELFTKETK